MRPTKITTKNATLEVALSTNPAKKGVDLIIADRVDGQVTYIPLYTSRRIMRLINALVIARRDMP